MDDGPYWVILLKYGSHEMRHTAFRRLTVVNGTPGFWGVTRGLFENSPTTQEAKAKLIKHAKKRSLLQVVWKPNLKDTWSSFFLTREQ